MRAVNGAFYRPLVDEIETSLKRCRPFHLVKNQSKE